MASTEKTYQITFEAQRVMNIRSFLFQILNYSVLIMNWQSLKVVDSLGLEPRTRWLRAALGAMSYADRKQSV